MRPGAAHWLAIAAGLVVFGYAGWDTALWDPRWQAVLHLVALGAIGGLAAMALRGGAVPRTRIDLPILGLLAAFAAATVAAQNPGLALRATAGATAFAAMLPVALVVLRHRPSAAALVVTVPTTLLAAGGVAVQVARRIEWLLVGAPGPLPPLRLLGEGTLFGSVAVPPFVLLALVPLTFLIEPPRLRRGVQLGLGVVGLPATVLSGSRSAWLAIVVAAVALVLTRASRGRLRVRWPTRWGWRELTAGAAVLAAAGLAAMLVVPRLTAVTSLVYRGDLWRDTLAAWATDPLLGIGPGTMPYARQAAAEPFSFPVRQPHSHNLPLGVLGDAGIIGLLAALVLVVALLWLAGPWRARSRVGMVAGSALIGFGAGGLFEDLTFLPNFVLLALLLVAITLSDAGAVRWAVLRPGRRRTALGLAGAASAVVLVTVMVAGDAAAIAYRAGTDAFTRGHWEGAVRWLTRSAELDPWHPTTPKALAVVADAAGDASLATAAARRAVELNAGDGPSWANLAILCLRTDDSGCALDSAHRALQATTHNGREAVNAALVLDALGRSAEADEAYRLSLIVNRLTALTVPWPRPVALGDDAIDELDDQASELVRLLAAGPIEAGVRADRSGDPAVRALAAEAAGDRASADAALDEAMSTQPLSLLTWEVTLVVHDRRGDPTAEIERVYRAMRGSPVPPRQAEPGPPALIRDIASFRSYPLGGLLFGAEHLQPPRPWPWILQELLP